MIMIKKVFPTQTSLSKTRTCNSLCVAFYCIVHRHCYVSEQDQQGAVIKTMTNILSKASVAPNVFFFTLDSFHFEISVYISRDRSSIT